MSRLQKGVAVLFLLALAGVAALLMQMARGTSVLQSQMLCSLQPGQQTFSEPSRCHYLHFFQQLAPPRGWSRSQAAPILPPTRANTRLVHSPLAGQITIKSNTVTRMTTSKQYELARTHSPFRDRHRFWHHTGSNPVGPFCKYDLRGPDRAP